MKTTAYIATSIDGYIAGQNNSLDFLATTNPNSSQDPNNPTDYGFAKFFDSVDALVMGRNTLETVLKNVDHWPYQNKPVIILSSNPSYPLPANLPNTVETSYATPNQLLDQLAQRGFNHIYIDGGITICNFLNANLLNQIIITRIPIILGHGIPLFSNLLKSFPLTHEETYSFPTGLTQSTYTINY
ncbi:dihydrofolate reductase family protein [Planctomycetota bacterium]|nr:dihydrofolate reductase family protein [Planctomycetota bacterium]